MLQQLILNSVKEAVKAVSLLTDDKVLEFVRNSAEMIAYCYQKGNKILICGNGGSLCDAMHFAEELTGQFRHKRKALPAIALSDPGHLSCVSNDMGFDYVFSRGVEAFGKQGDVLVAMTTSGNSSNILNALEQAKRQGLKTIAFLGKTGGKAKGIADLEWIVEGFTYSDRIQELHMASIHIIIEAVENILFGPNFQSLQEMETSIASL